MASIVLKWPARCRRCSSPLPAGSDAYFFGTGLIFCVRCGVNVGFDEAGSGSDATPLLSTARILAWQEQMPEDPVEREAIESLVAEPPLLPPGDMQIDEYTAGDHVIRVRWSRLVGGEYRGVIISVR